MPADTSILDFIQDDEDVARRAVRLGNAVLIAMALCLIAAPLIYLAVAYAI